MEKTLKFKTRFNKDELIKQIVCHSNKERQLIKESYFYWFNKNLKKELDSMLGWKYDMCKKALLSLMESKKYYEVKEIRGALMVRILSLYIK